MKEKKNLLRKKNKSHDPLIPLSKFLSKIIITIRFINFNG